MDHKMFCFQCEQTASCTGCIGKAGRVYENREGVALETQLMPNAINTEENPSTILRKGDKFESNTKYVFEIM